MFACPGISGPFPGALKASPYYSGSALDRWEPVPFASPNYSGYGTGSEVTKGTRRSGNASIALGLRLGPHLVNGVSLHCAYLQIMFQLPENTGVIDQIK